MNKEQWINTFRKEADKSIRIALKNSDVKKQSEVINKAIKSFQENNIVKIKSEAKRNGWSNKKLLNEILLITYSSYIVMLEYRNKVWPYEYMAFARRIGELWEPFCKLTFQYPANDLRIIAPKSFDKVQNDIKKKTIEYIQQLDLTKEEKRLLSYYYGIPWELVDSGGIKLELDLHFSKDGINYNCDFKSGFSSNEKGNTNRLLLVGSIYHSISENEKTILFVRQKEDQNNHYLQTLKNSPYWDCYCSNDCYKKMAEFTGFDLRKWLDENVNWKEDISEEFRRHLEDNDLIGYLTW